MYACQCFLPLLTLELRLMYWLRFWELLFNARKNVQTLGHFFGSVWNSFHFKLDSVLATLQVQWFRANVTRTLSFPGRNSKGLTEAESTQHPRLPSANPIQPHVSWRMSLAMEFLRHSSHRPLSTVFVSCFSVEKSGFNAVPVRFSLCQGSHLSRNHIVSGKHSI